MGPGGADRLGWGGPLGQSGWARSGPLGWGGWVGAAGVERVAQAEPLTELTALSASICLWKSTRSAWVGRDIR